jgi:hypothetical protein
MRNLAVLALAVGVLAGCSSNNARNLLGLERRAPDAYAVSTHAPLEIPNNLNNLPAPAPGVARPQEITAQQMARSATGMGAAQVAAAPSAAEQALLAKAGKADPNVRMAVNAQAAEDADTQNGPLDWMLFWREKPPSGVVVDAKAEAERLKAAKAAGQSVTATPTKSIDETGRLGVAKEIQ